MRIALLLLLIPATAGAAPTCWTSGAVLKSPATIDPPLARPTATGYPLKFKLIDQAEITRRVDALHARYPELVFTVDEIGVVTNVTTDLMPCGLAGDLAAHRAPSLTSQIEIQHWVTQLATELPDVPFFAGYVAHPYNDHLVATQSRDLPEVLTRQLQAKELDDDALNAKWATSKARWFKLVTTETTIAQPNPCATMRRNPNEHCDPPGPIRKTTTKRVLLGQKPAKAYLSPPLRGTTLVHSATTVELRRVATAQVDSSKLGDDLFKGGVETEFKSEIDLSVSDRRDAVTGELLAATPHESQ